MRWSLVVLLWLASAMVLTQAHAQENWFQADFRGEHKRVSDACKGGFKAAPACAIELFTDHPLHIAAGSLPAQNGFGLGLAFSQARNTTNWRVSWDADAVGSTNGSWRAGGYMKFVHTPNEPAHVIKVNIPSPTQPGEPVAPKPAVKKKNIDLTHTYTVFNLYAQTISLNKLNYFGEGNESALSGASVFGMTQTVVGASVIKPVNEWEATKKLNLSLNGEVNGRFVDIRGESGQSVPSIETLYTNATAPGLTSQPAFVQLGQGIRIKPVIADHLELNYSGTLQEFVAPSSSQNSFERWTVDLNHTLNLYGNSESPLPTISANDKGPDSCAYFDDPCPQVSHTRNLNGSIGARLLLSESINSATSTVPFYFPAHAGRIGHQWRARAGELSGLSFSRAESSAGAGKFRALDLGTVWREGRGGPGAGRVDAKRHRIRPSSPQLCGGLDVARGRISHGINDVCLGRRRRSSQSFQHESVVAGRISAAVAGLTA